MFWPQLRKKALICAIGRARIVNYCARESRGGDFISRFIFGPRADARERFVRVPDHSYGEGRLRRRAIRSVARMRPDLHFCEVFFIVQEFGILFLGEMSVFVIFFA